MILTIYLIGFIVALYLIAKAIGKKEEYFEGGVICYIFAFASWLAVLIILIDKYTHGSK